MNELTQQGINALKSGDRETARSLLAAAIKQNPNDAAAWLWLAGALTKDEERIHCLQQVLRIDPGSTVAARGLAQILERRTQPSSPQEVAAGSQPLAPQEVAAGQEVPAGSQPAVVFTDPESATHDLAGQEVPAGQQAPEMEQPAVVQTVELEAETAAPEEHAEHVAPAEHVGAVMPAAAEQPAARGRRGRALLEGEQVIFRTRPSVVPALIGFWFFLIGAIAIGVLLQENPILSLSMAIGLGFILEVIVIYAAIRNLTARYEMTNYQLTLRFRGQRVRVPVADIFAAECRQTFFQKLLGTGDLMLDASVRGELSHLRMRNIPECQKRLGQVKQLIPSS